MINQKYSHSDTEKLIWAQTINNFESSKHKVALLINFGTKSLEFKRFINTEKNMQSANSA
jgi:hypothetical protein